MTALLDRPSPAPAPPEATETRLESLDVALRRVRVLAAILLLVQLAGRRELHLALGVPAYLVGGLVAASLVGANLLSTRADRTSRPGVRFALSVAVLVIDAAVALVVVSGARLVDPDVIWALLVIPVLEGALRFRLRGAVVSWLGVTVAYFTVELWTRAVSGGGSQEAFLGLTQTLVHRSGVILLVAVPGGYLSDQLLGAITSHRQARLEAMRRSRMLEQVVDAGRAITRLDSAKPVVARHVIALGFHVADICRRDARRGWLVTHPAGGFGGLSLPPPDVIPEAMALTIRTGTVVAGGPSEDPEIRAVLAAGGLEALVLCPLRGRNGVKAVLRAGVRTGEPLTAHQVESLELLAGQASVALDNVDLLTSVKEAQGRLEHQAHHDALTGLANRVRFHAELTKALATARDTDASVAVLFLDLDRFKEVNDTWGHHLGDELLVAVSRRIQSCLRDGDLVARLGGDEFTVLLPESGQDGAVAVAERLCASLTRPYLLAGHEVVISTSVGIALPDGPVEPDELMRRADLAMYRAKEQGRDRWHVYTDSLGGEVTERVRLQSRIRRALSTNAFTLAYQPVVTPAGEIIGAEALVRWTDEELGTVRPDRFVRVAEDSGLITPLGTWALREACHQAGQWRARAHSRPLSIAVNVSPHQLLRPDFVEVVAEALRAPGLEPRDLILEITERVMVTKEAPAAISRVRDLGVRVALDDFGQGQTSIAHLRQLPLDLLKIDRLFVHDLANQPSQRAIVKSLITLGHDLGMQVIAEGVETDDDLRHLQALGCDAVQGYLLHRPLHHDAFAELLTGPAPRPALIRATRSLPPGAAAEARS